MKKYLLLVVMAFGFSVLGIGQILYEDFNYAPPAYIGGNGIAGTSSNNWTTHSVTTGQTTTIDIYTGNLSYPGLSTSSGYKTKLPGTNSTVSRDINRAITSTATVLYYSALINVIDATQLSATTADYFMHFGATAGSSVTIFGARLGIKSVNAAANYRLSILNTSGGTTAFTDFAQDLNFGTTYLVVVKYDRSTVPTTASLWVNPSSIGGAEPTGQVTNTSGTSTFTTFASICMRNSSGTPKAEIDELRVGTTWADVTPTGTIVAPTTQTSNFTFANVLQTQMNVSWTSGNGGNRVVKINTTNTFTAPADGSNPTANTVYGGSGEQVIYNGSGSTVPMVTGLSTATTYYFQAWEYNGTGTGTVFCTAVGANNPLSQATAASATAPVISSPTATTITATSAILGGNITADGGSAITERGTVWSTTTPVTIADNKLAEGLLTTGIFTHLRTGLPVNTLIHYAAYATNSVGTTLSPEATFTTLLGEPTNQASSFTATSPTFSSVVNTWLDNDGAQPATGFLILANTTGTFTDPVDGVQPTSDPNLGDGSGLVYVLHGLQTFTWSGLVSSTHYYFAIYAYTNTGTNINYKLVGAPAADVITAPFVNPVAAWTFDATPVAPGTPTSVAANFGDQSGTAMVYADGTNGSSTWITTVANNELTSFSGTIINDPREGPSTLAGFSYSAVAGSALSANGKCMVFKFSMSALQDAVLSFATRGTATGFTSQQWAWSTDNVTYTNFGGNTAENTGNFVLRTLDLTAITQLNGAPSVYLRITFNGATTASGNNRLDNVVIHASAATSLPPSVTTTAATLVQSTSATLNGTVNANNQSTAVSFEYGIDNLYGTTVAGVPVTVTGGSITSVSAALTGLAFNTTYHFRVNGTNGSGTSHGADEAFTTTCPTPDDAGQISGPATVCANGTQYQYSVPAITNATSYTWSFPTGAAIVAGDGTYAVTVTFAPGTLSGDVSVFGSNICGDGNASNPYAVTVSQPFAVSVSIDASANPVTAGSTVTFTATPTNGGVTPQYQWNVNSSNVTGATNPTYAYIPVNNDAVYCVLTSSETCTTGNPATSATITMVVNSGVPADLSVTGTVSSLMCYNATSTITVAGNSTSFEVLSGGSATMIAGVNIKYEPGTIVHAGGYMRGYIALNGPYCTPGKSVEIPSGKDEAGLSLMDNAFKIYPNPTSGIFTIEQRSALATGQVKVEVLGTLGGKILSTEFQGLRKQELSIKGNPPGIYFVKVSAGEKVQTVKIILTN